jgi:hypothetical protein
MQPQSPRRGLVRAIAPLFTIVLLGVAYAKTPATPTMASTARAFLDSLQSVQRQQAAFKIDDDERFNWFYTPVPRKGLPLRDMTPAQRQLAMALLRAGLSQQGYTKATTIMSVEDILRVLEPPGGVRRDPEAYFFSIFGEPSESGVWAYRIDGHHLSQNYTVVRGKVAGAPSFFGVNPAEVQSGEHKGLRVLAREEDLARSAMQALTPEQRTLAIVAADAPRDILTEHSRVAALNGQPSGIQLSALQPAQREKLNVLLSEYADNVTEEIAAARHDQIRKAGTDLWFAWAGGIERGQPHYYRIQTALFLIEYDDTQNNANHIHSVWRDFKGDFGRDLLAAHYQASHRVQRPPIAPLD